MVDQTVRLKTEGRTPNDVATELIKTMIENKFITQVDVIVEAYQKLYNAAALADTRLREQLEQEK